MDSPDAQESLLQPPQTNDPTAWRAHWRALGQTWRTEPEVGQPRRIELANRRGLEPSVKRGAYPFKGVALTRADVEWLLATHEGGRGPVDWADEAQRTREGLDLRGADLRDVALRGLPLARARGGLAGATPEQCEEAAAHLEGADLRATSLEGADLSGAHLEAADLRKALAAEAVLAGAFLARADLREATLPRANLRAARLDEANLSGAHLEGARLSEAQLVKASLRDAHLEGANFHQAQLEDADLHNARMEGAELREVRAERTNFYGVHLEGATLFGARLDAAILSGAHLDGTDLRRARLREANLEAAFLHGAALRGAHLESANLFAADLKGKRVLADELAHIRRWRTWRDYPETLPPADLRGAFFDNATNLRNITLGDAVLGCAPVADLNWGGANLAVVQWAQGQPKGRSRRDRILILGDEGETRRRRAPDGTPKDDATRIPEIEAAVRANRQLAVALQGQGLDEVAGAFAERAQILQRRLFWREGSLGRWFFSGMLAALAGYGYRLSRILIAYAVVVTLAALAFFILGQQGYGPVLPLHQAFLVSITAFHGRVFAEQFNPETPQAWVTALEAVAGLVVEGVFIAMLAQRFFGK